MWYAVILAVGLVPFPDCLPDAPALEVPVTVEVAEPAMVWGVVSRRPGPCPTCPDIVEYGWIQAEPSIDQAAKRLQRWRELPKDEVKRLERIVNAPAVAKATRQEWSLASCGMLCRAHGSNLYDVAEDGTVTLAKEQPAAAPNEGGAGYGAFRLFRRRR